MPAEAGLPRVVAVLAVRNEQRFIGACLDNLRAQGVLAYVCDNGSTDDTVAIVRARHDEGVIGLESIDFDGTYRWQSILQRKEALFRELRADWFLHADADEIHLPPPGHGTLREAFAAAGAAGYDAVEFDEFTFVPTRESPDHDHADFRRTLHSYYPFRPRSPHCVRAFRKQPGTMEIAWSGGHEVRFDQAARLWPERCRMRHYQFLSAGHAEAKYGRRLFEQHEVRRLGWHGWRTAMESAIVPLPASAGLRHSANDEDLDASEPWTRHWLDQCLGT
jgi:hypothetical protein